MAEFPMVVDAATAAVAIEQAGRAQRSIDIIFGDEGSPSGALNVHVDDIRDGFTLLRAGVRHTTVEIDALGERWATGTHSDGTPPGNPAVVIRGNGEIVLTYASIHEDF